MAKELCDLCRWHITFAQGLSPFYGYGGHFEFYGFKYLLWDAKGTNKKKLPP